MKKILQAAFPIAVSVTCLPLLSLSQNGASGGGIFDLLSNKKEPEITIRTDMDSLFAKKKTDEYIAGTMEIQQGKKEPPLLLPVRIKNRGKFRRMKCDFPPLKLKFKKDDLKALGLNKFNELKLVTHCLDDKTRSRDLILRENLIYKLYNELTPYSFRAHFVKVEYECTRKKSKLKRNGMLLEDPEDLANRLNAKLVHRMGIPPDSLHSLQEKINSLFQFMVSNTDWSYQLNRNIELLLMPDGKYVPVPYDFDFSGVVFAPYSRADSRLGQKTVRDRVFIGNSKSVEELKPAIKFFLDKKEKLLKIVNDYEQLEPESRDDILAYLESFFVILQSDEQVQKVMFAKKE